MEIKEYIKYPASWVNKVADNLAIEALRKSNKRQAAEYKAVYKKNYSDLSKDGTDILNCLEERERKIMYLRYWENYKLKEIAEILDINYSTLKSAHKKAKSILKKLIDKDLNNEKS